MAHKTRFKRLLQHVWDQRTAALLRLVTGGGRGPVRDFSRQYRDRMVEELVDAATSTLKRRRGVWPSLGLSETIKLPRKSSRKIEHLRDRFDELGAPRYFVYAFYR